MVTRYVGTSVQRVEDPRHLRGRGQFVPDINLAGLLHVAFIRSAEANARITATDVEAALSIPGVVDVLTGAEFGAKFQPMVGDILHPDARHTERQIIAHDRVRFVGEIIGVVVAESRYIAEDGVDAVVVSYESEPAVSNANDALREDAPVLHAELGWQDNCMLRVEKSFGNVDEAFRNRNTLKRTYRSGRTTAMALEPRGCIAQWDPRTDGVTLWSSTQIPHLVRTFVAKWIGIPETRLRVIAPDVGGGFGQKATIYPEEAIIAYVSKALERPVKWVSDRREDILSSHHAREHHHDIEVAFDDDGLVHGIKAHIVADVGAYSITPWSAAMEAGMAASNLPGPYKFQNYGYQHFTVLTNKAPLGPYRGVGRPAACFSIERTMDEVARALGLDPIDVRIRNTVDTYPHETASGMVLDSGSSLEVLEKMKEVIGWDDFRRQQEQAWQEGRYVGVGLAQYVEQTGHSMVEKGLMVDAAFESATVRMEPDGRVLVTSGSLGHGQGHETTFAQLAADQLGVPFEDVTVIQGDTATVQYGIGTFASRSAVLGGGAVVTASRILHEKLRAFAADRLEAAESDLELENGAFQVKGVPGASVSMRELAWLAYTQGHMLGDLGAGLSATSTYTTPQPKGAFANSLHAAVVEVDPDTGSFTILRYVVIHDCGTTINPMIVDGQIHGGTVQGLGGALYEHVIYNDDGQPMTTTLLDYLLPGFSEMPSIETHHFETPAPDTALGIKGMGEGGAIAPGPAIANAVSDALQPLGVSINQLPVTPEVVYRSIHDQ